MVLEAAKVGWGASGRNGGQLVHSYSRDMHVIEARYGATTAQARRLADALAAANPPVMVRDYQTDLGYFDLDPCNLHPGEAEKVAHQLAACLRL